MGGALLWHSNCLNLIGLTFGSNLPASSMLLSPGSILFAPRPLPTWMMNLFSSFCKKRRASGGAPDPTDAALGTVLPIATA